MANKQNSNGSGAFGISFKCLLSHFCCFILILSLHGCSSSGGKLGNRVNFDIINQLATKPQIVDGVYLGAIIAEGKQSMADLNARTSFKHAAFGDFFAFPNCVITNTEQYQRLTRFLADCRRNGAIAMVTIELKDGYGSYSKDNIETLASLLKTANLPVFLRWAHEMNGSWYAWGQQPSRYIQSFREVAQVMKAQTENVAMTWTPNQGWGYPWNGGLFSVTSASADFNELDTNQDGVLDENDDPYLPYYPGDDVVDWVGFSFYHWSNRLERGFNEAPPLTKWGEANGIGNPVINFHDEFALKKNKPMMVAETSAFFDTTNSKGGNANEVDIKKSWIKQVYNLTNNSIPSLKNDFSNLKAIFWFNIEKFETETNSIVDWRISFNQEISAFYSTQVSDSYFIKANDTVIISE